MDCAGNGFLAGAGLADDQHWQAVAGGLGGDGKRRAEFGRGADELLERQRRREFLGNRREFAGCPPAVGIGGKRLDQALGSNRAHEEIRRAGAHRLDCDGDGVAVREDDDRQVRPLVAQARR